MTVILIGRCSKKINQYMLFSFHGHYRNQYVKKIMIEAASHLTLNEDYLVHLEVKKIEDETMYARLLKARFITV